MAGSHRVCKTGVTYHPHKLAEVKDFRVQHLVHMEVQSDPGVRCCSEGISHQRVSVWVEVRATTNQVHPDFQSDGQSPAVVPTFRTGDGGACQSHDLDVQ